MNLGEHSIQLKMTWTTHLMRVAYESHGAFDPAQDDLDDPPDESSLRISWSIRSYLKMTWTTHLMRVVYESRGAFDPAQNDLDDPSDDNSLRISWSIRSSSR